MSWFTLYLLVTLIPSLAAAGWAVFGITCLAVMGGSVMMVPALDMGDKEYWQAFYKKWFTRAMILISISGAVGVVLPGKNELMVIVAGSTLIDISQTDRAKGIADQSLKVVEKWLAEQNAGGK